MDRDMIYKEKIWKNDFSEFEKDFEEYGSTCFLINKNERLNFIKAMRKFKKEYPEVIEIKVRIADFGKQMISGEGSIIIQKDNSEKFKRKLMTSIPMDTYSDLWIISREKDARGDKECFSYSKDAKGNMVTEKQKVKMLCFNGHVHIVMDSEVKTVDKEVKTEEKTEE